MLNISKMQVFVLFCFHFVSFLRDLPILVLPTNLRIDIINPENFLCGRFFHTGSFLILSMASSLRHFAVTFLPVVL